MGKIHHKYVLDRQKNHTIYVNSLSKYFYMGHIYTRGPLHMEQNMDTKYVFTWGKFIQVQFTHGAKYIRNMFYTWGKIYQKHVTDGTKLFFYQNRTKMFHMG